MCDRLPDISLVRLLERVEPAGDCLEWTAYATSKNQPQWCIKGKCWPVRRLLWLLTRGPLREGLKVGTSCVNELCVHPDHLIARTQSKALRGTKKSIATRIKIAISKRKNSHLTEEVVRLIKLSAEPGPALAKRYGINSSTVNRVRNDTYRKDYASPFAHLGARQ